MLAGYDAPPPSPLGHNSSAMTIPERLSSDYGQLVAEISEALKAARRLPSSIVNDADLSSTHAVVGKLSNLAGRAEEARKAEKDPYLNGGREVDAWFKTSSDRIGSARKILDERGRVYLRAKADEERRLNEERERLARKEAEEKLAQAREAERLGDEVAAEQALQEATAADTRAEDFAQSASAGPSELARTKTVAGTAGLRTAWSFEIIDLGKIPLEPLRPYIAQTEIEKALRGFVRAGGRQIPGVRIFEGDKARWG